MDAGEFDFRNDAVGRKYPTTSVKIWMDEEVWFAIDAIEQKLSNETDADKVVELEAELEQLHEQRDQEAYRFHLRAISNRANEDIISKALATYPIKRDLYGRDDFDQERARNKLIQELSFSQRITKIVNPAGQQQTLTDDNRLDVTRAFLDEAPAFSIEIVDRAIGALGKKFQDDQEQAKSPDFS